MQLRQLPRLARMFLEAEWRARGPSAASLRRRLWLYRHGFLSRRDAVWDLAPDTVGAYLTDRQRRASGRINEPYVAGLRNKLLFRRVVGATHGSLLPEAHALLRDGAVVADAFDGGAGSADELLERLAGTRLVAKPVDGAKGDAVRVLDATGDRPRVDGEPVEPDGLVGALSADRDLLVEAHVQAAGYAVDVFPAATNSVRLLTMVDPGSGEPFLAAAMHRFGTGATGTIDNWDAGGLSAGIDRETGELGTAVVPTADGVEWTDVHPDSGVRITGRAVPGWDRVVAAVLDLAGTVGALWPYVGWDVVVTDDEGTVALLEGNSKPGVEALQAHQPLLRDERVRRFFRHHGVLEGG